MLRLERILGNERDADLSAPLHRMRHEGLVEYLFVAEGDIGRRRYRQITDRGTECGVALHREERIVDGAVLYLDDRKAIIVRVGTPAALRLRPRSVEAALCLGWNAGNLHWRVKFDALELIVLLDGRREDYLARISGMIEDGSVEIHDSPYP